MLEPMNVQLWRDTDIWQESVLGAGLVIVNEKWWQVYIKKMMMMIIIIIYSKKSLHKRSCAPWLLIYAHMAWGLESERARKVVYTQ